MRQLFTVVSLTVAACGGYCLRQDPAGPPTPSPAQAAEETLPRDLGSFSLSLAVKDIDASLRFYRQLGFTQIGGSPDAKFVILQNETATVGLFEGMFERNIMTFNPGWDRSGNALTGFTDVRDLQARLEAAGIELQVKADKDSTGPAHFMIADPDGNPILFDQHVPRPGN